MIMKNIIDYVREYGKEDCYERPFCETDALVLSRMVYFRWSKSVPGLLQDSAGVRLSDIYKELDHDFVYKQELYPENDGILLKEMAESVRFGSMICNYYSEETDEQLIMQFGAMLCQMEGALPIILYKGTDRTIVGWKEDFYMAFSRPISGQQVAAWYLNEVAQRIDGKFMVSGHSKGGNLSAFASMAAYPEIKERIDSIYSFDGPGFRPEILEEYDYNSIAGRVKKYMPHSSLVGIVLEGSKDYIAIRCEAVSGAFAHNPYKWIIENGTFVQAGELAKHSVIMHKSLNEWIMELDEQQFELMVDNLFGIFESTDEADFNSILSNWKSTSVKMMQTAANMDKEQWKNILAIIKALLEEIAKTSVNSMPKIDEIRQVEEKIGNQINAKTEMVKEMAQAKAKSLKADKAAKPGKTPSGEKQKKRTKKEQVKTGE